MTLRYNRTGEREKRRALRRNPTEAERRLWYWLRGKQLGVKFHRQYSVDACVIDFFAPACRLAVEVDGDSHFFPTAVDYDRERTTHLARFGIEVLRFTNAEVLENIEGVLGSIEAAVKRRSVTSPNPSLVRRGSGAEN